MKEAFENAGVLKTKTVAKAKQISLAPNDVRIPTINKVKETVAVAKKRQYIVDIPYHIRGLVNRIRHIQMASLEEQAICSSELKALEDEVLAHLNSGDELLKSAACQAYAIAMVETLPPNKRLVMETIKSNGNRLPGLLGLKILEPVGDAKNVFTVKIYGDTYKVGGSRDFAAKLAENLSAGVAHAAKIAYEFYHSEVEGLKAQATISVAELLVKKPGRVFMTVSDVKDGSRFLPGGALLAESDGRTVEVVKTVGHFARIMSEIAEAGMFVSIESLSHERPELAKRLPEDAFRRVRIFHAILRRGIAAETQKKNV